MSTNSQDRGLIAIVAGVVLLVLIAFVVVLRQAPPEYRTDNNAEAAAHNYLLALRREDYARAYSYLSPNIEGYPDDLAQFTADVVATPYLFGQDRNEGLAVISSRMAGDDLAVVTGEITTFNQGDLFGSSQYSYTFQMTLAQEAGGWQITNSDQYWLPCWTDGMCR